MNQENPTPMNAFLTTKRLIMAGAIAGSLVTGAALGAATLAPTLASAATTAPGASSSPAAQPAAMPAHGSAEHEGVEAAVTGDNATKAKAAALKAVGGGTAGAVTTDFTKNGYEVTVTKADGTQTEVHLDSSFNVMQGHGGHGGPAAPPANG